ncbi:hypothetical protein FGO68_gene15038 [Halteria grandinella]|uniref:Uncharacterized protein n=1 Tax=Halteria grandinella TaxID=5974 RepID=A0A8J8NBF9_HALGN|nr:hypothetical protein FGO68_gene15038 [Halteria grandinella]
MSRHRRFRHVELVADLAGAHRPLTKKQQNASTSRIRKGFEHLIHISIVSQISKYVKSCDPRFEIFGKSCVEGGRFGFPERVGCVRSRR